MCHVLVQLLRICQCRRVGLKARRKHHLLVAGLKVSPFPLISGDWHITLHLTNTNDVLRVVTVYEDLGILHRPFGIAEPCFITTKIHSSLLLMLVTHLNNNHLLKSVNFP